MQALRVLSVGATCLGALACSSVERSPAPVLEDCVGANCRPVTQGGSSSPTDASAANDAQPGSDAALHRHITADAVITIDSAFVDTVSFRGPIEVHAHNEDGSLTTSGDAPVIAPAPLDVAPGAAWLALIDRAGTPRMAPTLQLAAIDATTTATVVRGLAWDALNGIVVDDMPWAPQNGAATFVLSFGRKGATGGLRGVTVSPVAGPDASVAYFASESRYTSDGPTTDFGSTVLVRDITHLPPYPTLTTLAVQYQVGSTTTQLIAVRAAPNFVTWVRVEVPPT